MTQSEQEFENEVRRIARALWPSAQYQGATIEDGRERDGVFITDECVHLIECTVSRKQEKAKEDIGKLVTLAEKMKNKYTMKAVKCWFVTFDEPTPDQRKIADKHSGLVVACSLGQFRSRLVDAATYIECRKNYRFGSMQDLEGSGYRDFHFVEPDILTDQGEKYRIRDITTALIEGKRVVLVGDYGAGKSTTMREIFLDLQSRFLRNKIARFPILLNLRDHYGQTNAAEALERHARNVGYATPSHLVKAWLAGYAIILLDGFDEIAIAGWSGQATKLKKLRHDSMQLIREFVRNNPHGSAIAISGRGNYFDSSHEMQKSFGLEGQHIQLTLSDFTDEQILEYLRKKGLKESIPSWLPSRPLLLGYLASRELLNEAVSLDTNLSPAMGWDALLGRICDREAEIEVGIDGETIRHLIERLASKARREFDGIGPLQADEIVKTFQEVCGYPPDDRSAVLIQRLPGLGVPHSEDGSRRFVDQALADAASAGDVVRYIESPYSYDVNDLPEWQSTLRVLGRQVAAYQCMVRNVGESRIATAIQHATKQRELYTLCADVIQIAQELRCGYSGSRVFVKEVLFGELSFGDSDKDYSFIEFQDCIFQLCEIAVDVDPGLLPRFTRCYFGTIEGRVSEADLPGNVFSDCIFESFSDSVETNAAILSLNLPLGLRVMLVILKKLYLQPGSGRQDSAIYRGLDQRARSLVPQVLQLLKRENLVIETKSGGHTLWLPIRSQGPRIRRLISAPTTAQDDLAVLASSIR